MKKDLLKGTNANNAVLVAEIREGDKLLHSNTFYFLPVKDLNLPKAEVNAEVAETATGYTVTLSTATLAKNVYLSVDDKAECFFSDNYFDLFPGEKVTIECKTNGVKIDGFGSKLKVMSIADSY